MLCNETYGYHENLLCLIVIHGLPYDKVLRLMPLINIEYIYMCLDMCYRLADVFLWWQMALSMVLNDMLVSK